MGTPEKVLVMPSVEQRVGPSCPYCGSRKIWQARPRGIVERHLFRFFQLSPHQCPGCDRRFYTRAARSLKEE